MWFVRSLHSNVTLFSVFLGRKSPCTFHAEEVGCYIPPPIGWSICIKFFCMGDLFSLHLLSYSVIYLCEYGLMDFYFILWVIIQHYFIILWLRLFQLSLLGALSVGSCVLLTCLSMFSFFCFLIFWH